MEYFKDFHQFSYLFKEKKFTKKFRYLNLQNVGDKQAKEKIFSCDNKL